MYTVQSIISEPNSGSCKNIFFVGENVPTMTRGWPAIYILRSCDCDRCTQLRQTETVWQIQISRSTLCLHKMSVRACMFSTICSGPIAYLCWCSPALLCTHAELVSNGSFSYYWLLSQLVVSSVLWSTNTSDRLVSMSDMCWYPIPVLYHMCPNIFF